DLVPLLARNAAETERLRRLPDTVIDALQTAGLLRITIPRRFGGYQVSLETKVRVAAELARGCGSARWTGRLINVSNRFTALWPPSAPSRMSGATTPARKWPACSRPAGTYGASMAGRSCQESGHGPPAHCTPSGR